jgi:uncharacterized OB-fold protein
MSDPILPTITELNRPFWDGCAANELRLQTCRQCGTIRYPVAETCPACLSEEADWRVMSGRGEVLSAIVFHRAYHAAWEDRVPYNVVLVQLAEGPRMFSNVLPLDRAEIPAGTPVQAVFDATPEGISIPRFVPAEHGSTA